VREAVLASAALSGDAEGMLASASQARWIASFIPATWRLVKLEWQAVLPISRRRSGMAARPHGTRPISR